jgi:hypothetical protein
LRGAYPCKKINAGGPYLRAVKRFNHRVFAWKPQASTIVKFFCIRPLTIVASELLIVGAWIFALADADEGILGFNSRGLETAPSNPAAAR